MKQKLKAMWNILTSQTFIVSTVVWKYGVATITTDLNGSKHGLSYAKEDIDVKYNTKI
jgi:hypothetical protein